MEKEKKDRRRWKEKTRKKKQMTRRTRRLVRKRQIADRIRRMSISVIYRYIDKKRIMMRLRVIEKNKIST